MANFNTDRDIYPIIGDSADLKIQMSKATGNVSDGVKRIELHDVLKVVQKDATVTRNNNRPLLANEDIYYFLVKETIPYLNIHINGKVANDFCDTEMSIKIIFKDNTEAEIKIQVRKQAQEIKIVKFQSAVNFLQKGKGNDEITLNYEIEGEGYTVSLLENAQKRADCPIENGTIKVSFGDPKSSGLYEYTLLATKDNQQLSKSVYVYYLEESTIQKRSLPNHKTVINFCTSQEGDYLYALMYEESSDKFEIGITNQIDGKASWLLTEVTDTAALRSFVTAPMVHLQSTDERTNDKQGRLLFIGGSRVGRIKHMKKSGNQVATIDLGNDNVLDIKDMKDANGRTFYKYGHTCVLFPTQENPNTLWMLGGQDEWGNTSNDVWTSTDGINWKKGEQATWTARVMGSVTVSYNASTRKKDALWLAGGFSEFAGGGGGFQNDVWKYSAGKWERVDLKIVSDDAKYYACSIAYGGIDTSDSHTGLFVLEAYTKGDKRFSYIKKLLKTNNNSYKWESESSIGNKIDFYNNGVFITAFFDECLWFLGTYNKGAGGISFGELNYKIPTVHQTTINFYKNKLSEK